MDLPPIPTLLQFGQAAVHAAIRDCAKSPDTRALLAVDATCGNGHDSLFLAESLTRLCGGKPHMLLALDVQQQALDNTRELLARHGLEQNAQICMQSHEALGSMVDAAGGSPPFALAAVMYNLGYLPGSDKKVVTTKGGTLPSLEAASLRLAAKGLISAHAYGGHPGGREELEALDAWSAKLDPSVWKVASYSIHNKPHKPETLFLIQKRIDP